MWELFLIAQREDPRRENRIQGTRMILQVCARTCTVLLRTLTLVIPTLIKREKTPSAALFTEHTIAQTPGGIAAQE